MFCFFSLFVKTFHFSKYFIFTGARNIGTPVEGYQIYSDMIEAGIKPDIATYTILVDAFGSVKGNLETVEEIIEVVDKSGIEKNEFFYCALLDTYAKRGELKKVFGIINRIEKEPEHIKSRVPQFDILVNLLKCYVRRRDKENAVKVYRTMTELEISNPIALNHLISLYGNLLDLPGLTALWKEEAINYAPLRLPTLYLLFEALGKCKAFGIWPLYLKDIKEHHLEVLSTRLYLRYLLSLPVRLIPFCFAFFFLCLFVSFQN